MTEISEWIVATDENGERIDLIEEAREIVAARGHAVERDEDSLHLPGFGLRLYPRGLSASSLPDGGARSITVVHVTHPAFESGLFEYQHGVGNSLRESLRFGLDQWAQLDLPVLCDATREQPEQCAQMVMSFPAEEGKAERQRRILLGPVMHMARNAQSGGEGEGEEHPFCPCCLTTNSLEVFMPLIQADTALGVRLLAMRGEDGETGADCRINGDDFEEGMAALRAYAAGWPGEGYEVRKQYVMFQTLK